MSCPKTGESSRYSSDRAATNESAPCIRTRGRQHILRRNGATRMYHLAAEADQTNLKRAKQSRKKKRQAQAEQDKRKGTAEQTEQRKIDDRAKQGKSRTQHRRTDTTEESKTEQNRAIKIKETSRTCPSSQTCYDQFLQNKQHVRCKLCVV